LSPNRRDLPRHLPSEIRGDIDKHLDAITHILDDLNEDKYATLADDLQKYLQELRKRHVSEEDPEVLLDAIADELEGLL
jgi:DNA polymerase II large subunit